MFPLSYLIQSGVHHMSPVSLSYVPCSSTILSVQLQKQQQKKSDTQSTTHGKENERQAAVYVSAALIAVIRRAASYPGYRLNPRHDHHSGKQFREEMGLGLIPVCTTGLWQGKKGWPLLFWLWGDELQLKLQHTTRRRARVGAGVSEGRMWNWLSVPLQFLSKL